MFDILAIEDDRRMRELLKEILSRAGCSVFTAKNGEEGLDFLERRTFDLVITDLKMPDIDGITILSKAREFNPEGLVIVITAYGTVESAIEAMKLGAYDYIQKPFEPEELMLVIKKALDYKRLADENLRLSSQLESCKAEEMIGASPRITEVKRLVDRIAPLDITVVIEGETGTGKNLVAKTIHRISKRASGKFLSINCGALTETLLESELFGHEKGAFTGAVKQKHGLFEAAHGGTLFLDEINSASPGMQIKLLKVLEDGMIMRIGSTETVPVDVRIIAASNILLKKEIDESRFRQDLYYRLKVVTITMPSLRERRDDIPLLAHHFRDRYRGKFSKDITGFTTEAMDALLTYDWPGNVRELEHVIERSVILEYGKKIDISSLPAEVVSRPREILSPKGIVRLEDMERQLIQSALRFFNGKRDSAARALGISHATLWRKVKKYNLD